ncbi:polysaccharide biosynthesis protein [Hellea balneolensis]|uniref:polysaccharide biosynthesis protein n=1 Tax=Hellea balneolensis TaxID=287478 RepID=UPI00047EF843|nr:polysaccharide biosynthesis protein [Hellea balneolensis]
MSNNLANKSILINGGTGSFGNMVLRSFLTEDVKEIRVLSRDEKKQDDMRKFYKDNRLKFYIGDVRNIDSVRVASYGVDYIFHAAALKQVPSCEFFPMEAVKTNVEGTDNTIRAAIENDVKQIVVLSTDKAVYPINAMGISKAMMEKVAIARSRHIGSNGPIVNVTRYGNVMASRGSVIPLFTNQILSGGPVTVTNKDMTRFLMSLPESVALVKYAYENGNQGDTFVQKSPAATIETLYLALMKVFEKEVPVKSIGIRHGEKMYEALAGREEMQVAVDEGNYLRIPCDARDLNYDKYVDDGDNIPVIPNEYSSQNTNILNVDETAELLLKIDFIQQQLGRMDKHAYWSPS